MRKELEFDIGNPRYEHVSVMFSEDVVSVKESGA
jgi:hypothetical protein